MMTTIPALLALVQEGTEAVPTEQAADSPFNNILFPLSMLAILFYVILIMPEKKQRKKREAMLDALKKGDRVLTTAGIYGQVANSSDDVVTLQVADGVRMKFSRAAVQQVIDPKEKAGDKVIQPQAPAGKKDGASKDKENEAVSEKA